MNLFRHFKLSFDRSFSKGIARQVVWLLAIMAITYGLLILIHYIGRPIFDAGKDDDRNVFSQTFLLLMDPGNYTQYTSSPYAIIGGTLGLIVFSGMLISVISNLLERRVERYSRGETEYNVSHHVVVLGTNKTLPSLLRLIHQQHPKSYIVIMCEQECEKMHRWLHQATSTQIEKRLIILHGVRYADEDLLRLKLNRQAKEVYILGEEDETAHDANNMECLKRLAYLLRENSLNAPSVQPKLKCHVLLESQVMYKILQAVDIDEGIGNVVDFLPFNFNDIWAQKVLATIPYPSVCINGEKQPWTYRPLDDTGITARSKKRVHLIVFGMNKMGEALAVNAAHILHFPNFMEDNPNTCSLITFIDGEADTCGKTFRSQYPHLFKLARWKAVDAETQTNPFLGNSSFIDIEWEFMKGDMSDDHIKNYLEQCAERPNEILTIAFCHHESEYNAACCMAVSETVLTKAHQILVRQKESPFVINMLMRRPGFEKLRPFGIESECYYGDVIHECYGKLVNACYSGIALNDTERIEKAWNGLSTALKWSNIYCANMLYSKLRFMGLDTEKELTKEEIETAISQYESDLQRTEHNRWNMEKLLMGYRPLKDEEERRQWQTDKATRNRMKASMMHLDLLPNEMLKRLDPGSVQYDIAVNRMLGDLYFIAKQHSFYA